MKSLFKYNSLLLILALFSQFYVSSQICIDVDEYRKTTYVRYGRKTCPDTADIVYEGRVAGSKFNEHGGGMNLLCLPLNPVYEATSAGETSHTARIFGSEYAWGSSGAPVDYHGYSAFIKHIVPCAVCLVRSRDTALMVPARNDCPSDEWTKEYSGYLMAEWTEGPENRHRTEFVCIDKDMESATGSQSTGWGSALYFTEAFCRADGGLPCGSGEYVDGNELTCAICTI